MVLTGIRITATAHCAPPDNKPSTIEKQTCAPWLDRELDLTSSVQVIVALGGIGWEATLSAARRLGWQVPRPKPRFGHEAVAHLTRPDGREPALRASTPAPPKRRANASAIWLRLEFSTHTNSTRFKAGPQQQPEVGAQHEPVGFVAVAIAAIAFGSGLQPAPSVAQACSPAW